MVDDSTGPADGGRPASEPFLAGERVSLRALERDDIGFVRDTVNDPRVRPALGLWYPNTRAQEEAWFDEATGREDAFAGGAYEDTHYYGLLDREWRERDGAGGGTE